MALIVYLDSFVPLRNLHTLADHTLLDIVPADIVAVETVDWVAEIVAGSKLGPDKNRKERIFNRFENY